MLDKSKLKVGDKVQVTQDFISRSSKKAGYLDGTFVNHEMLDIKELSVASVMISLNNIIHLSDGYFYNCDWLELVEEEPKKPFNDERTKLIKAHLDGETVEQYTDYGWENVSKYGDYHAIQIVAGIDLHYLRLKPKHCVLYSLVDNKGVTDVVDYTEDQFMKSFDKDSPVSFVIKKTFEEEKLVDVSLIKFSDFIK